MSEINPPVAPVVTSEMVEFAYSAWRSSLHNILPEDQCVQDHYDAMRAAISVALEASGELERLRAALKAAEDKQCASCRHCDSFGLSAALQGDAP